MNVKRWDANGTPSVQPFYRFTSVSLETASSSTGNGRACAPVTVLPLHPFTEGRREALSGIGADARSCAHLVMSPLPPKADIG
jgi:hypothetical protein